MLIELLWSDGCPNHGRVRKDVERALVNRGIDASELRSIKVDGESAVRFRFPGSPTIRVNGRDIEPRFEDRGDYTLSCRLYGTPAGLQGVPDDTWIEHALDAALDAR